jgi:hypothetical protein
MTCASMRRRKAPAYLRATSRDGANVRRLSNFERFLFVYYLPRPRVYANSSSKYRASLSSLMNMVPRVSTVSSIARRAMLKKIRHHPTFHMRVTALPSAYCRLRVLPMVWRSRTRLAGRRALHKRDASGHSPLGTAMPNLRRNRPGTRFFIASANCHRSINAAGCSCNALVRSL